MSRALSTVLTETLEAATQQLSAARQLDSDGLADATASRQDLQFELELIQNDGFRGVDEGIAGLVQQLQETDRRLVRVLGAATAVFREVLQTEPPQTYGASGRIRER